MIKNRSNWISNFLIVSLIFLIGCFNQYWLIVKDNWAMLPGDLGDARLIALLLEHSHRWLMGDVFGSFWGPSWNFYPQTNSLAMSDIMLGATPFYTPWRILGVDPWTAFQYWVVTSGIANFWSAWLLGRKIGLSSIASAFCGYIFAFSLPRTGFFNHPQLMAHWWTPLALTFWLLAIRSKKNSKVSLAHWSWSILAGLCLAAQFWSAFYLGWFLGIFIAALILAGLICHPIMTPRFFVRQVKTLLITLVIFLLSVAPLATKYLVMAKILGPRSKDVIFESLPTLYAWALPTDSSYFYSNLFKTFSPIYPNFSEYLMFPGLIPLLATIFFIIRFFFTRRRKGLEFLAAFTALLVFCVTLRIEFDSLWPTVMKVIPGSTAIRAMSRLCLPMLLPLGICAGASWDLIIRTRAKILGLIFGFILIAEQYNTNQYAFPKIDARRRSELVANSVDKSCLNFYYRGREEPEFISHLDAMTASMVNKIPTLNGYSGGSHPIYNELALDRLKESKLETMQGWLSYWKHTDQNTCIIAP